MASLTHTGLYSEDAYTIITLAKCLRFCNTQFYAPKHERVELIYRIRRDRMQDWHVLRAPDGEVLVYHHLFGWGEGHDTVRIIKADLKSAIEILGYCFDEEEPLIMLPRPMFPHTNIIEGVTLKQARAFLNTVKQNIVRADTDPKLFGYEKIDVDYALSHPTTIKRMKEVLGMIGTSKDEASRIDPIRMESRKIVLNTLARAYDHLVPEKAEKSGHDVGFAMNVFHYFTKVDFNPIGIKEDDGTLLMALPFADKLNLKTKLHDWAVLNRERFPGIDKKMDAFLNTDFTTFLEALKIANEEPCFHDGLSLLRYGLGQYYIESFQLNLH